VSAEGVRAHGRSDVGQVRSGNEDALLLLTTVFAVADGMGGHRAGEVAAATALEPLVELDGRHFDTSADALRTLGDAAIAANTEVSRRSIADPALEGMGTTLTAVLIDGRAAHVVHVGDSRAYLLRDGRLDQVTEDHTLVQALIDQGRITRDEAGRHPHRSVITRAIGVATEVEVDAFTLELRSGDVLLLCSDGLTGVVDDTTIAAVLSEQEPHAAVDALIDAANAAGGPDNITVLVLTVEDRSADTAPLATAPLAAAAPLAAVPTDGLPRTIRIRTDEPRTPTTPGSATDWAQSYSAIGPQGGSSPTVRARRREGLIGGRFDRMVGRILLILVTVALLSGVIALGAQLLLDRSYSVGVSDGEIVIFRGIDARLGPIDLLRVHERPGILLEEVPVYLRPIHQAGRPAADLRDARRMIEAIPLVPLEPGPV
jgi:protein phosphatase